MFEDDLEYFDQETKYINGEDVLEWIFEHDNFANEFLRKFGLVDELSNFGQVFIGMSEVNDFEINEEYFNFEENH